MALVSTGDDDSSKVLTTDGVKEESNKQVRQRRGRVNDEGIGSIDAMSQREGRDQSPERTMNKK
jgi:hypothetical protein